MLHKLCQNGLQFIMPIGMQKRHSRSCLNKVWLHRDTLFICMQGSSNIKRSSIGIGKCVIGIPVMLATRCNIGGFCEKYSGGIECIGVWIVQLMYAGSIKSGRALCSPACISGIGLLIRSRAISCDYVRAMSGDVCAGECSLA